MPFSISPALLAAKLFKPKQVAKLVSRKLTLNRAVVSSLAASGVLTKKQVEGVALKVLKSYKARFDDGEDIDNADLMVQRVQNTATEEISDAVKKEYKGFRYEWLPSDAQEPDPLHQLKYGKRYTVGVGEMPGDRFGCRCGMRILTDEDTFKLNDIL